MHPKRTYSLCKTYIDNHPKQVYNKAMERRSEAAGRFTREVKLMTSKEFEKLSRAEQLERFEKHKKAASAGTLNR